MMNELEKLCSPSRWSKRLSPEEVIEYHINAIAEASEVARRKIPHTLNILYGSGYKEKLDVFGVDLNDDAPIFVFLHGGYWQEPTIGRSSYQFIAEPLYKNGIKTIFVGYELAPDLTLPEITERIQLATKKCIKYAREKKSKGLYLAGHSAGAQLVATLFTGFIASISLKDQQLVRAAILISGVFDLTLIQKSTVNECLKLNELVASKMSPLMQEISNGSGTSFLVAVAENDSPEFIRQSKMFHEKLHRLGIPSNFFIVEHVDHFDIMESMSNQNFKLTKSLIGLIKADIVNL